MLLSQDGADQATDSWAVREDAHHIGAAPYLLVETLQGVVGPDLLPVGEWEAGEGQDVGFSLVQSRGDLWERVLELSDHPLELGMHLLRGRLLVDGAYHGGHPGLSAPGDPR